MSSWPRLRSYCDCGPICSPLNDPGAPLMFDQDALHPASPEETVARGVEKDDADDRDDDDNDKKSPWYREVGAGFGGGLRFERPTSEIMGTTPGFDTLLTLGGTAREIHGSPVVGVAETADLSLGMTLGGKTEFAYDMSIGFGPGIFLGDAVQLGATVGFGFSQITGGILPFGFKVPTGRRAGRCMAPLLILAGAASAIVAAIVAG